MNAASSFRNSKPLEKERFMRELAQWVRVLDAKPEGPGISGTHIIEGENQLP